MIDDLRLKYIYRLVKYIFRLVDFLWFSKDRNQFKVIRNHKYKKTDSKPVGIELKGLLLYLKYDYG